MPQIMNDHTRRFKSFIGVDLHRRCRKPLHGFTLLEALVVVVIIALLLTLLVPAIGKAKDAAKAVQCGSNVRQILVGLLNYAMDNVNYGPAYLPDGSDAPASGVWADLDQSQLFLYGGNDAPGFWWGNPSRTETPGRRKLHGYTSAEVHRCPSDIGKVWPEPGNPNMLYEHTGNSYPYNSHWYGTHFGYHPMVVLELTSETRDSPWVLYGRRFASFDDPSSQIAVGDATLQYTWLSWNDPQGPHGTEFAWHDTPDNHPDATTSLPELWFYNPKANVGFLDGHVEFIRLGPHDPGQDQDVDRLGSTPTEHPAADLDRGAGGHDVVDQEHPCALQGGPARRVDRESAGHVVPSLGDAETALGRGVAPAQQQVRHHG